MFNKMFAGNQMYKNIELIKNKYLRCKIIQIIILLQIVSLLQLEDMSILTEEQEMQFTS